MCPVFACVFFCWHAFLTRQSCTYRSCFMKGCRILQSIYLNWGEELFAKSGGLCRRQLTHRPEGSFPVWPAVTVTSPHQLFHTHLPPVFESVIGFNVVWTQLNYLSWSNLLLCDSWHYCFWVHISFLLHHIHEKHLDCSCQSDLCRYNQTNPCHNLVLTWLKLPSGYKANISGKVKSTCQWADHHLCYH